MSDVNIYDIDLDQTPANYTPLSPLTFIRRTAAVYPDLTSVIHGARRYHLVRDLCPLPATGFGFGKTRRQKGRYCRRDGIEHA